MIIPRAPRLRSRRLALALLPVVVAVGCGSDDADPAVSATDSASSDSTASEQFCSALVATDALDTPGGPVEATPEDVTAFGVAVRPLVDQLVAGAPASAVEAMTTIDAGTTKLEGGDGSPLEDEAFFGAVETLEQAGRDGCGFSTFDVTAKNYAFGDVPATVPAGPVSFRVTNSAAEPHVLLFVKKPDDVTDDASEVGFLQDYLTAVSSGDPAAIEKYAALNVSGGGPGAGPNGVGTHVTNFEPGTYVYFCPIPVGLAPDGAPHFTQGMHGEFTVA